MVTDLVKLFKTQRKYILFTVLAFMTLFIASCSTQPTLIKTKPIEKTVTEEAITTQTAEQKLALAQSLNSKLTTIDLSLSDQQAQINELLISASELFLLEKNFPKALWLADKVSAFSQDDHSNHYRLLLVKAASLQALNYHQQAYQQLLLVDELVSYVNNGMANVPLTLTLEYYLILTQVLETQAKPIAALNAQLHAFALNSQSSDEDILAIWHKFETLTQWQLAQLVKRKPPFIKGWQSLLNYSYQFGINTEQFDRYLTLWQRKNPTHPAMSIISQIQPINSIENSLEGKIENIAVLLPLSGAQKNAGLAAQQGILAAYDNNPTTNIHFIDTNQIDWQAIALRFSELKIDHVIGPLLKANVEEFLGISLEQPALQIPTLLLNLPSQQPLTNFHVALSMRPEDEAIQAAAMLSQQNYSKPIVLSHQDRVSKRIAIAFREQWLASTGNSVDIIYFNQGKAMQASLKESLDVNASQTRIKQLNDRIKNVIKAESRNRRDIDMIYLVGTAAQTRLIKPYIDVNTSPFADIIPVYASSRSHSNFYEKNNTNSANDLEGLTFTQIPWLLKSGQQNKKLAKLSDQLWPKRTDSLSSIFAMGFDSYHLLGKIRLMQQAPYIRHFGQTGVLRLNNNNILTRSLIWGRYQKDKVAEVVMD